MRGAVGQSRKIFEQNPLCRARNGEVMVVDLILDRKDWPEDYDPAQFYRECMAYGDVAENITMAMDYGTEKQVKRALCDYIVENQYNPAICDYINSVSWL